MLHVELFATNVRNPSHMEWTLDGRLLVSEHTSGRIMDITEGGDMLDAEPYASGLQGPASILPLGDGRILVAETWGGTVRDIQKGGNVSKTTPFADGLSMPYSLAHRSERTFVSESFGPFHAQITEITDGGKRKSFRPYITRMPSVSGAPGLTPISSWPDEWENFAAAGCIKNWETDGRGGAHYLAVGPLGQIFDISDEGGRALQSDGLIPLVEGKRLLAWGLGRLGGIKEHPTNGLIYAVEPELGNVVAVDPSTPRNYRFEPPVVRGLNMPTCPRFSEDGETMYVCGSGEDAIWKITGIH